MNKLKIISLACLLASTSYATTVPCNGFKINLKNHLAQDLVINKITLTNAKLQTDDGQLIAPGKSTLYTVNSSSEDQLMVGEVALSTRTDPTKQLNMQFTLSNQGIYCKIQEVFAQGDLSLKRTRMIGGINYKIVEGN